MARERLVRSIQSANDKIGHQYVGVQPRRKHPERRLQQFQKAPAFAVVAKTDPNSLLTVFRRTKAGLRLSVVSVRLNHAVAGNRDSRLAFNWNHSRTDKSADTDN
jgi:hypothetical protein